MKTSVQMNNQRWAIAGLTAATAVIHLLLGLGDLGHFLGIMMLLNGLGYLGLLAAYFLQIPALPLKRAQVRWLLMGFAAVTIVAYFAMNLSTLSALGLITKAIEAILIFMLWRDQ